MKRAIITGATGFIGYNLVKELINNKWKVSIIQRANSKLDVLNEVLKEVQVFIFDNNLSELELFFKNTKADVVFHLASLYLTEHKSNQINDLIDSNIIFGLNILEAMKNSNTKLIINTGTSWQHYKNEKYNPVNLYAATKQAFEDILRYYIEIDSIKVITLKLFDTYGVGDTRKKILNIISSLNDNSGILEMSPGNQFVDMIHVTDIVNSYLIAYEYLLKSNKKILTFGVGSKRPIKLKKIIQEYEGITNKKLNINWGGKNYRNREVLKPWTKYKRLPGWKPNIPIKKGLDITFNKNNK